MTRDEFQKLIAEYDTDGDGTIDWEEFCVLMKPAIVGMDLGNTNDEMTEDDIKAAFNIADADGSGYIEKDELGALLASLGEALNTEDLDALFDAMDDDKSGGIDFEEFKCLMTVLNQTSDNEQEEEEEESTSWEYEECSHSSYTYITDSQAESEYEDVTPVTSPTTD